MARLLFCTYGHRRANGDTTPLNSVLLTNAGAYRGACKAADVIDLSPEIQSSGIDWTGVSQMQHRVVEADVLHCQAGVSLEVMRRFREVNPRGRIVLQRDSTPAPVHMSLVSTAARMRGLAWEHQYKRDGCALLKRECEEYDLADHIFTLSRWVTDQFRTTQWADKAIQFSSQLADASLWWPAPTWAAREQTFTAVAVGSLGIRKGTLDLLDAWAQFWPQHPESRLLLAGVEDGAEPREVHEAVRAKIRETPQCIHLGWVPMPHGTRQIYQRAHVLVSAAVEEGSTMPGVEAALCGIPIVAPENAGIDLLEQNTTGFWCKASKPNTVALALNEAHAAFRSGALESMGNEARRRALKWDIDGYAESYARTLREVMA